MTEAGVSDWFWGAAELHAAELHNRTAATASEIITPIEMLMGCAPEKSKLRIFGCLAFIRKPTGYRVGKLNGRAEKCMYMGITYG